MSLFGPTFGRDRRENAEQAAVLQRDYAVLQRAYDVLRRDYEAIRRESTALRRESTALDMQGSSHILLQGPFAIGSLVTINVPRWQNIRHWENMLDVNLRTATGHVAFHWAAGIPKWYATPR